ncbi:MULTISPECIES: trehalose-6-phosphate synthase [Arthrobacter]|uniref:Trehalose-6-phosphate synthase n=2 Tax=Arthrobacter TaxID=1663 RepID=A0ABU9KLW1_9MICC|nr:trehalose-6-phosphate synthase [Arthrobacter sp. YJM1]MDP5227787.1 trehalose-6-phosphate synthase [Arthrobacter sp. YJM1]
MRTEDSSSTNTGALAPRHFDFVVVANRLPVDRVVDDDGALHWRRSPGGLVTALAPVMQEADGAWVGWHGASGETLDPFNHEGTDIIPVPLSEDDVEQYYEGFSNATLWPLYHDVTARPEFHRAWWDAYRRVNRRFAEAAARAAAPGATVWVQDYQLQLVPRLLRQIRPDLTIGFFNHIPFPPQEIFAQLPWRREVLEGLLGADLVGFQRSGDARNFVRAATRLTGASLSRVTPQLRTMVPRTQSLTVDPGLPTAHHCVAEAFPISIEVSQIEALARDPKVVDRARRIRFELGNPRTVLLGVDRLDYTKGIRHRLKAYEELLKDGDLTVEDACLIQVASPSREQVEEYRILREEIEGTVGHINGAFDTLGRTAVRYLHHSYPVEEMVALYLAADVMLITALKDGMNLVAKEYVTARVDNTGALVLSEFTGAADQLKQAFLVNPHDIDGLKSAILSATRVSRPEAARRMRSMRRQVTTHDVRGWSTAFLERLAGLAGQHQETPA